MGVFEEVRGVAILIELPTMFVVMNESTIFSLIPYWNNETPFRLIPCWMKVTLVFFLTR